MNSIDENDPYYSIFKLKIMNSIDEKKTRAREIALKQAKIVLAEAGIDKNNQYYSLRLFEMQYRIYHELKLCFGLPADTD